MSKPCFIDKLCYDILIEIFDYFDINMLYRCLFVKKTWFNVAVRKLWKLWMNIDYSSSEPSKLSSFAFIRTLFKCLSTESKALLSQNGISIPISTSNSSCYKSYPSYCNALSIDRIDQMIQVAFEILEPSVGSRRKSLLLLEEILKMFKNKVFRSLSCKKNIQIPVFPGTTKFLTKFICISEIRSDLFNQIRQECPNLQILTIIFGESVSNGLKDLIISPKLKHVILKYTCNSSVTWPEIRTSLPSLTKHSTTSTIIELDLSDNEFFDFNQLLNFGPLPQLKILRLASVIEEEQTIIEIIEIFKIHGKNLEELALCLDAVVIDQYNSLNSAIADHCPNLKTVSTVDYNKLETSENFLKKCSHLVTIELLCKEEHLEITKNSYELKLCYIYETTQEISLEELRSFSNKMFLLLQNLSQFNEEFEEIVEGRTIVINRRIKQNCPGKSCDNIPNITDLMFG
ncbi:hypothetical protein C1645_770863 [Glomus cerebriforme]|uniref:F-box domain-containing protein n=1 Tax=Glomus cerebriforme TaxID=658196 RepID=A0A397T4U6_9GLOM|nr:hypothetical protein C1645_770863 [Glomus cerebriforme]